jgi:aminopeptidase N
LAGIVYNKLETHATSGDDGYYVKSAWDAFSKWACELDNKDCTTRALEYFNKWQTGERYLVPGLEIDFKYR